MAFAAFARWARPRNAQLSVFGRRLMADMRLHRGVAATPLLRLAAEPPPLSGFVEQRGATPAGVGRLLDGEALDDAMSAAAEQAVASIISGVMELDAMVSVSFSEMLELTVLGIFNGSSCRLATYKPCHGAGL
mmetsp:Transcript_49948/g.138735  ORF Transcript_49948/g.138735 Transcript_49948/m.138735 type:complete len:133 (-) Transcript_49948:176-574(-)